MVFKNFWWSFPRNKSRNLSLKSWSSLCLPKDQGGLGFRLMKDINLSLITKLGWKLLTDHDNLWVSLFNRKYIKYGNLLACPLSFGSFIGNGIKAILPILTLGACYIPHFSNQLSVWLSPWIPTLLNFKPIARYPSFIDRFPLSVADLICPSTRTWNMHLLPLLFTPATVLEILNIGIRNINDSLLWTPSSSGVFSTKSAHHLRSYFAHLPSPSCNLESTLETQTELSIAFASLENGLEYSLHKESYFIFHSLFSN